MDYYELCEMVRRKLKVRRLDLTEEELKGIPVMAGLFTL